MDKVIIFGTYHFLGFATCVKLLEEGIQVIGYRLFEEELEEYLEEKRLFIGRNANFEERNIRERDGSDVGEAVIVIPFYDFYYNDKRMDILFHPSLFEGFTKGSSPLSILKIICIFPYQFMNSIPLPYDRFINSFKKKNITIQSIFLPTIYGPWQPKSFLFQKVLLNGDAKIQFELDEREYTGDAIYINDLIEEIIPLLYSSEISNVMIQSAEIGNWEKCVKHLKLDLTAQMLEPQTNTQITNYQVIKVKEKITFSEGLSKQKKHLMRLID